MKVPAVVQMTSMMITDSATLGPASHAHQDNPSTPFSASAAGGSDAFHSPRPSPTRCSSPRESLNQVGPSTPIASSIELMTPPPLKRNRNTRLMATELTTDGK